MGGGTKHTSDAMKGRPFDLLAAIAESRQSGAAGDSAQAAAFCSRTNSVPFRATSSTRPVVGARVRLAIDEPPIVISDGVEIGRVDGAIAMAMRGCIALGYEMTGTVVSFDEQREEGMLTIAGSRRQVA